MHNTHAQTPDMSTNKECDYLTQFECQITLLYDLPKFHKNQTIKDACNESNSTCMNIQHPTELQLILIVAGPKCETHRVSNFLDILLKPFLNI